MNPIRPSARSDAAESSSRLIVLAACFAATTLVSTYASAGSRVFYDGFESGSTSLWATQNGRNKCTAVSTADDGGAPRAGRYMMRCNWNGTVAWNDPAAYSAVILPSWSYTNEFLLRFWYRADRNVDSKPGSKLLRMGFATHNDTYWATQFEQSAPSLFMSWTIAGSALPSFWGSPQSVIGDRRWHRLELYIKHDTDGTDGIIRVWVDGERVFDKVNIRSHAPGTNWWPLDIPSNWSNNPGWEHDATNAMYIDEVEIYSDIGSGSTGTLYDATAAVAATPTSAVIGAPSNLRSLP